jgi:hypothetical protein
MVSTRAVESNSSNDGIYTVLEGQIATLTTARDALAVKIRAALDDAAFRGVALDNQQAKSFLDQANALIKQAHDLANP